MKAKLLLKDYDSIHNATGFMSKIKPVEIKNNPKKHFIEFRGFIEDAMKFEEQLSLASGVVRQRGTGDFKAVKATINSESGKISSAVLLAHKSDAQKLQKSEKPGFSQLMRQLTGSDIAQNGDFPIEQQAEKVRKTRKNKI